MPCYGPEGPPSHSDEWWDRVNEKAFVDYMNNTAALLESISEEPDEKRELAKSATKSDQELSDYVTDKLCTILTNCSSDKELLEKVNNSKYAMQIGIWWEEHQQLDKKRNQNGI